MGRQAELDGTSSYGTNVPFLLSNVFSLIAKLRSQGKKDIRSSKNILVP